MKFDKDLGGDLLFITSVTASVLTNRLASGDILCCFLFAINVSSLLNKSLLFF
jgi:hypothetical protein